MFLSISHIWPVTEAQKELYESDEPIKIDEKVLSLSVYTPCPTDGRKRPVMVWIHGGAWQFGSAEMQNGAALAKYGDVIVVALSYRLGVFGFLFGNWGLWDQIRGLEWVQVRTPDSARTFGRRCSLDLIVNRNFRRNLNSINYRKTLNHMVAIIKM